MSKPARAQSSDVAEALHRVREDEKSRQGLIAKISPAVCCIFPRGNRAGGGSGVIIDSKGYGLTNFHVIANMLKDRVGEIGLPDGRIYPMEVLGIDPSGDVAMFRVSGQKKFPTVELGDSDSVQIGQTTLAIGNPFLLAEDYTPTITMGIVSGVHRYQAGQGTALRYTDCIQVDTSINPGNSGGPLFNLKGEVIGINGRVSIEERDRVNVGVGYAIAINQIKHFIPMLRAGLTTQHATAGFTVVDSGRHVVIDQIAEDSDAYRAGLREGDRLLRFAGIEMTSANRFASVLGTFPARWPVQADFEREDKKEFAAFRLADLPLPKDNQGKADPFPPHAVTDAANGREVRRILRRYQSLWGGANAAKRVNSIHLVGRRSSGTDAGRTIPLEEIESRSSPEAIAEQMSPVDLERAARWQLLSNDSVVELVMAGGDEVDSRLAVVLKGQSGGRIYELTFDVSNGQLVRIAFRDSATSKEVMYSYADYRSVGEVMFPHRRELFLDGRIYAVDKFERVEIGMTSPTTQPGRETK